jgi:predicted GH43/DUF377 family glycosyl hydrolase
LSELQRQFTHLLFRPQDVTPSRSDFEVIGTFNPGVVRKGGKFVLLVRVVERPLEQPKNGVALPRWQDGEIVVDSVREDDIERLDPRVVRIRQTGLVRLTFISYIWCATSQDGISVDPGGCVALQPAEESEEFGVEDPRITEFDGTYYITYVAVSRHGAVTALAATRDFVHYERLGIIFCTENKDVVLFPETIGGQYVALHRPNGATPFTRPEMWIARSNDLIHWGGHEPLKMSADEWQSGRVGGGAPPLRTDHGWLEIYHANKQPTRVGDVGAYYGAAMLLDIDDPARVIARARGPILSPVEDFETAGFVNHVVFPTAAVESGDDLLVYYGASDMYTGVVGLSRRQLLDSMTDRHV